ncbi:MAG: isochorismatase family protein [Muribaculaceae bacterium]|nr:isochorismatase family protein [Muribaculaceae bacterium]
MDSENKILLIIDPQVDFITGSLSVGGALETMDALADYIRQHGDEYRQIIVTADRHPMNHCSFKRNGGIWPTHCVADSVGAAIWQPIMDALIDFDGDITILHKGEKSDKEEYSIFKNEEATEIIKAIIRKENIKQIDICGIAGDVCVADSIRDGAEIFGTEIFRVLPRFTPSIDGGATLSDLIAKLKLSCDR